jgi:hypothetical protein
MPETAPDAMIARADAAALAVDAHARRAWAALRRVLRQAAERPYDFRANERAALAVLRQLPAAMRAEYAERLRRLARLAMRQGEREADAATLTEDRARSDPATGLPDAPTLERLLQPYLAAAADWQALGTPTDRKSPDDLARLLASRFAQGKTVEQVEADLRPYFEGVRSRAARAARTFGAAVQTEARLLGWSDFGGLLVGYRLLSARQHNSRPWHAARHGRVYYLRPGPGQSGLPQMPRPPLEPPDPTERPHGTPAIAWH